jgi:hypothetical protein
MEPSIYGEKQNSIAKLPLQAIHEQGCQSTKTEARYPRMAGFLPEIRQNRNQEHKNKARLTTFVSMCRDWLS